jgi:rhamnosyltransferase
MNEMRVLVLLSTYNGEAFLAEQLDSLYSQEGVELFILVRDDGSKDNTALILDEYNKKHGRMTIIRGQNIGAGPSFLALINEAVTNYPDYDYYAFCDQDDVWFSNKVVMGIAVLTASSKTYKLFFSKATSTDADLHPIQTPGILVVNSFGANLVANHILGCCMIMNLALLQQVNKINTIDYCIPDGKIPIHDGWAATVAYSLNADVISYNKSLMYYRQHGHNEIGAGKGRWSIFVNRVKRYAWGSQHGKSNRCIIALQVLGDAIPEKNRHLMNMVATYRQSISTKMRLLFDRRMYEYGIMDNIGTFFLVLFNRF